MLKQSSVIGALAIAVCANLGFAPNAIGDDSSRTTFNVTGTAIIIHSGSGKAYSPLKAGWTRIGPAETINCNSSAGCTVVISATISADYLAQYAVCTFLDGVGAVPLCKRKNSYNAQNILTQQYENMAQGSHILETKLRQSSSGGLLGNWTIQYTIYQH